MRERGESRGFRHRGEHGESEPISGAAREAEAFKKRHAGASQTTLWKAIKEAETILLSEASEPELKLRCVHALSQAIGQYAKVTEVGELESRIEALEQHRAA
ncbi:MAG: hypothetical protein HYY11_09830 [Candidatus Methylomirabilis oxyfera]|nr:hypothetical protein [Candidatus Methylomirabilis oxyfera]